MAATAAAPTVPVRLDAGTVALIAFTVLAWASAFPAIRAGLADYGPVELGSARFAVAAVPAALYLLWKRPPLPARGEWWRFIYGGVFFVAGYTVLLNIGELTVTAGAASFIINVAPVVAAILAVVFLRERMTPRAWAGTALSFGGIGLIAFGEGDGLELNLGAVLILGAALCAASTTIIQKPLFARHGPLAVSAWNMVIGALCLLPGLPSALEQTAEASAAGLVSALYLGLIPSLAAYATWTVVLSRLPASRAINFMFAVPPTATLMGFLALGEIPTPLGVLGGVLALGGVVLVNVRR
jgi:drug/metabolite transporter (DMT)-like permease